MKLDPARLAIALLGLAVVLQLALARRWQQQTADHIGARQALVRQETEVRRRLRDLEREARLREDALALIGRSASTLPSHEALQKVRGRVVHALSAGTPARLEVQPGPPPATATVGLSTSGDFVRLVDLVAGLTGPRSGLLLSRASFNREGARVAVRLEALALGAGSTP